MNDAANEPGGDAKPRLTKPGTHVWIGGHNAGAKRKIERHLHGTIRPRTGPIDTGLIAPQTAEEAAHFANKLRARLRPDGCVWVVMTVDTRDRTGEVPGTSTNASNPAPVPSNPSYAEVSASAADPGVRGQEWLSDAMVGPFTAAMRGVGFVRAGAVRLGDGCGAVQYLPQSS